MMTATLFAEARETAEPSARQNATASREIAAVRQDFLRKKRKSENYNAESPAANAAPEANHRSQGQTRKPS